MLKECLVGRMASAIKGTHIENKLYCTATVYTVLCKFSNTIICSFIQLKDQKCTARVVYKLRIVQRNTVN